MGPSIGVFENDDQRYKDDVVELKFGLVMKHRSFPNGEREGEWGRREGEWGREVNAIH